MFNEIDNEGYDNSCNENNLKSNLTNIRYGRDKTKLGKESVCNLPSLKAKSNNKLLIIKR